MTREEVYNDIRQMFGEVPAFIEKVPDSTLELEWLLYKQVQLQEGAVPNKYRELIGIAISAVQGCTNCVFFHTEVAKLYGATEVEIEDAMHYAKSVIGWSMYLHGIQVPVEELKEDVRRMCAYVRSKQNGVKT